MNNIHADQLHEVLQRQPKMICIDVRFEDEDDDLPFPLPARNISWYTPEGECDPQFLAKVRQYAGSDSPILLFCRSGKRSAEAALFLESHGYRKVYNLSGGCLNLAPRLIVDRYAHSNIDMHAFCV